LEKAGWCMEKLGRRMVSADREVGQIAP
jgi:hypothetical protein